MCNIGILTFHRSLNYGAFMQAYSLLNRIQQDFPSVNVEIIDYSTKRMQKRYSSNTLEYTLSPLWNLKTNNIKVTSKKVLKNIMTSPSSSDFLKNRKVMKHRFEDNMRDIKLSDRRFISDSYKKLFDYIDETYDIVIVGSDCVWEINNYPFPNAYYLNECRKVRKMSYAACAQGVLYKNLSKKQIEYMGESWKKYDYIGARDTATEQLLKSIEPKLNINHNCDPTLFLDIDSIPVDINVVKEKLIDAGVDIDKPIIGLMGNEYIGQLCRDIFGYDYQIVALYEKNKYADFYIYDLSPFEWSKVFQFFSVVFTDRYHGTLLSLKNGIPPISLDYAASNSNYTCEGRTKIQDLYYRLDLEGHYYVGKKKYTQEEKGIIKNKVIELMENSNTTIIKKKIKKEAGTYESFQLALGQIINQIQVKEKQL